MKGNTFQTILLVVFGLLALVSLFLFANFSGDGGENARAGKVSIWGTLPKGVVDAGIAELTAAGNEYSEVTYTELRGATFSRDLADAIAEGRGPDLVILSQEELVSEKGKLGIIPFQTLPERTFVDSFVPEFELFLSPEGAYGIPLVLDPLVLYYNRTILSSEGVASAPRTWEGVAGLASAIVERNDAGVLGRSLIPFGSYTNVTNARAALSLLFLQSGTSITTETERGVQSSLQGDTSFGRSPAESALTYYAQFSDTSKTVYSWNQAEPASRQAFLAGDLALYPGFASELTTLQAAAPNLDFDMALVPQSGTATSRMTYGKAYVLALAKATTNVAGAYKVAQALSVDKPALAIARTMGAAPARRALLQAPASDRYAALYYPEALVAKGWLSPSPAATDAIFSAMIMSMTTGREDAAEALEAAGRALDAALR